MRPSHSQVGPYCSHLPIQSMYPSPLATGKLNVSARTQPSQVSVLVVGTENAELEGTVRYELDPLNTAALSPLGRVVAVVAPPLYVPLCPLPDLSASPLVPGELMARYITGESANTTESYEPDGAVVDVG